MNIIPRLIGALALSAVLAGLAGDASADTAKGRYQLMKATEDRVWRLDTQTGEIAVCTLRGESLVCTTSSDAATPPKKSYGEMQADKAAMEKRDAERRRKQQETEMKMLDRILAFFRELITLAKEQEAAQ